MEDKQNFTQEQVDEVAELHEKRVIDENTLSPEDQKLFEEMLAAAKMPVTLTDEKFKLGESELDVRELSDKNYKQIMFRAEVLQNVYLKQTVASLSDIIRLLMALLKKVGSGDILKDLDDLQTEINESLRK